MIYYMAGVGVSWGCTEISKLLVLGLLAHPWEPQVIGSEIAGDTGPTPCEVVTVRLWGVVGHRCRTAGEPIQP